MLLRVTGFINPSLTLANGQLGFSTYIEQAQ
jgi:hypothetical protein